MTLVLVCGGRNFDHWPLVYNTLNRALKKYPDMRVMAGGAKGADSIADNWTKLQQIEFLRVPAKWKGDYKAAGPIRNKKMLEYKPDLVIAFPGGPGTAHMVKIAKEAGVKVIEVPLNASD